MTAPHGVSTLAMKEQLRHEVEVAATFEREAAKLELEARAGGPRSMERIEQHIEWPLLSRLPMRMTAQIPLPTFRVKDLLALEKGQLVLSDWLSTDDVPLKVGTLQLSWSEFEVVEQRMAVRLTRLA